jgi:5'-3' exonuclease
VTGEVDSVVTEDSDALAYLAPKVIVRYNEKREMIDIKEACQILNLSPQEFQHMCILFGNDFNGRITGIGPVKAYSLIKKYSNIDNVLKHKHVEPELAEEMQKTKKIFEGYCHEVSTL